MAIASLEEMVASGNAGWIVALVLVSGCGARQDGVEGTAGLPNDATTGGASTGGASTASGGVGGCFGNGCDGVGANGTAGTNGLVGCFGTGCAGGQMCVDNFQLCGTNPSEQGEWYDVVREVSCQDHACSPYWTSEPVCGCDGAVHANACEAAMAGVDLSRFGTCAPPSPDYFQCGYKFCKRASEYCAFVVIEASNREYCEPIPDRCQGDADPCTCIGGDDPCARYTGSLTTKCGVSATGGIEFMCIF